jgi:tape measure domain-containing protein
VAESLGEVGAAYVTLSYDLSRLAQGLQQARQQIAQALDGLGDIAPGPGLNAFFSSAVTGAGRATEALARVTDEAQNAAAAWQNLEIATRNAIGAMREASTVRPVSAPRPAPEAPAPVATVGSATGVAAGGIAGIDDRTAVELERAETRAEAFQRALVSVRASVNETADAMAAADRVFAEYGQEVGAAAGDTARLAVAQTQLQRELGALQASLAAVARAEGEAEAASAALAAAEARTTRALETGRTQAETFRRSLAGIGAGAEATSTALERGGAAFSAYEQAVAASAGRTETLSAASAQLRRELAATAAEAQASARAQASQASTNARPLGGLGQIAIGSTIGGVASQGILSLVSAGERLAGVTVEDTSRFTELRQQLTNVVGSVEGADRAYQGLFQSALKTGSSLEGSVQLFTRLTLTTKDYGVTVADNVRITDTLNRVTASSGASAEEAQRAYVQLTQALAKGKAEAQDLKDIQQNAPAISQLLQAEAQKQGTSLAQLQATTGVTARFILQAMEDAAQGIIGHIGDIPETTDRSLERVKTAFFNLTGELAKEDAFGPINQALDHFAASLEDPAVKTAVQELGADLKNAFSYLIENIPKITGVLNNVAGFLNTVADPKKTLAAITGAFAGSAAAATVTDQAASPAPTAQEIQHRLATPAEEPAGAGAAATPAGGDDTQKVLDGALAKQGILQLRIATALKQGNTDFADQISKDELDVERQIEELRGKLAQVADDAKRPVAGTPGDPASVPAQAAAGKQGFAPILNPVTAADEREIEAFKKKYDLEGEYAQQVAKVNALKEKSPEFEKESAVILAGLLRDEQRRLETAKRQQEIEALVAKGHPRAEAESIVSQGHQPNAGLTEEARLKKEIAGLQDLEKVAPKGDRKQIEQEILQIRQKLVEVEQRRSDQLSSQRDAILAQGTAEQKLQAALDKTGRESRPASGQTQAVLNTPALRDAAKTDAYDKYAKAIEQETAEQNKSASTREVAQAKINALQEAEVKHGEGRAEIDKHILDLRTQIGNLDEKDAEKLATQAAENAKSLDQLKLQAQRAQRGEGTDAEGQIKEAGQAGADRIKLPTAEERDSAGGAQAFDAALAAQEQARGFNEATEKARLLNGVLSEVQTAQESYTQKVAKYDSLLKAGVITQEQYERGVLGALTPSEQFAEALGKIGAESVKADEELAKGNITLAKRNALMAQEQAARGKAAAAERQGQIGQLYDRGDPGSGASIGQQIGLGAQAGGLEVIEQYGNAAKATGQFLTTAFQEGTEALTDFIMTGKGGFPQLAASLEQLAIKMIIQIALARLLAAAMQAAGLGGAPAASFGGGGGGSVGGGFGSGGFATGGGTAAHGLAFSGGDVTPLAKGGMFGTGGLFSGPTLIPLAHGSAIAGEAGAEAAVPLIRTSDGNLGIRADGMGGGAKQEIHIHDQRGTGAPPVETQQNGNVFKVFIKDAVQEQFGTGVHDRLMRSRFGITPASQR